MKEIVDAILKAEQDAKQKVEEARKKARQTGISSENSAREQAERMIEEAKQKAAEMVKSEKDKAVAEKQRKIDEGAKQTEKLREEKKQGMEEAVEEAFRLVLREGA